MSNKDCQANTNTNSQGVRVSIAQNQAGKYVVINAAAKGYPGAVFNDLANAMAAAYRLNG